MTNKECDYLHEILNKGLEFNFKKGEEFQNYLDEFRNFPKNGIYLMLEKGETGHYTNRIVRVGINRQNSLANRLNTHINGKIRRSIFRKHLFRIKEIGSEENVTKHIKNNISFFIINDPENKRKELEKKIIGTISNCVGCPPSKKWLGKKSEKERIRKSGLWNVHYVYGENSLNKNDLGYIEKNLYGKT